MWCGGWRRTRRSSAPASWRSPVTTPRWGSSYHVISRHIRHITSWQVQLRLQQVVAAPTEAREELLKDLEQFAFRGIPNMRPASTGSLGLVRGACDCEAVML